MPGSMYNYNDPGLTTSTVLANDLAPLWLRDEVLAIAERETVFADIADEIPMPDGEGKTVVAVRYERLPLPLAPLIEGITPDSTPLVTTKVEAMLEQWGMVVALTDVALMTVKHPALQIAKDRLGTAGAELMDREIQRVLAGGGQVTIAGGKSSVSALVAGDVVTTDLLSQVIATLRQIGAPSYPGGLFAGVVDPYVEMDIAKDPTFVSSHTYAEVDALLNAEIGRWRGVRWKRSNTIPIVTKLADASATAAAADVNTPQSGETNFAGGTTQKVQVSLADSANTGFPSQVSTVKSVTNAGSYTVAVTIPSGAATGTYSVYVGTTIPTYQASVQHTQGTANVVTFAAAGTPNGANRYIATTSGAASPPEPPATGGVHTSYVFGKGAFGTPHLGPKIETTITPATPTDSDPLKQRRKAGVKAMFKAVVLNRDFYRIIFSLSAYN